ncbi:MAG: HAD-IIIC family phosphatase [Kiritimatiellae bacterium]|nr:HAD-IIIC family phosphatase [Kiritimatiellia bacterium]
MKIALTGDVALELIAPYFRKAGFDVYVPAGFAAWRQELIDKDSPLNKFGADLVFDVTAYDDILSKEVPGFFDERMRVLASMPYSLDAIDALVDEAEFSLLAAPKKILALDADNTLWKGILSEDGRDALKPFTEFQKGVLELRRKGVVLVLLTKNDPNENFMRSDMPIKDADFAVRRVNWAPKAGNLIEACRELNLSTDSVVFVDDNPFERAQMKAHLPEVTVAPFPKDLFNPAQFLRRLGQYFFSDIGKTDEDRLRAADYASRAKVDVSAFSTVGEYLESLKLEVAPSLAQKGDIPRLAQMAGKTNQFNATTIRRDEGDFERLLGDDTKKIFVFRTRDKFAEQGIVCYIVADLASKRITDFVMSCRAMGRTLEFFAYDYASKALGEDYPIDFSSTKKNAPFMEFLQKGVKGSTYYKILAF